MAKKYYVVWKGRKKGVFTDWDTCKQQVDGFAGARYKSFKTRNEAEAAFSGKAITPGTTTPKKKTASGSVNTHTASDVAAIKVDTKIFTDGGCEPNPGEAGSGIAIYRNDQVSELWYGLYNPAGTNNTAELNALHHALMIAKEELGQNKSVVIFCDSKYSIQCITQWAFNWAKKGWTKSGGEIKNLDLIKKIFALYKELRTKLQVLHVNGHVGVEGNELADRMSILAMDTQCKELTRYSKPLDIDTILAMRTG